MAIISKYTFESNTNDLLWTYSLTPNNMLYTDWVNKAASFVWSTSNNASRSWFLRNIPNKSFTALIKVKWFTWNNQIIFDERNTTVCTFLVYNNWIIWFNHWMDSNNASASYWDLWRYKFVSWVVNWWAISLYIDWVNVANWTSWTHTSTANFYLWRFWPSLQWAPQVDIDELIFYNNSLMQTEITNLNLFYKWFM